MITKIKYPLSCGQSVVMINPQTLSIEKWEQEGVNLLVPQGSFTSASGKERFSHHCFPFFGSPGETFPQASSKHGFLRNGMNYNDSEFSPSNMRVFNASYSPGVQNVEYLLAKYTLGINSLEFEMTSLARSVVQYAFHPYFPLKPGAAWWKVRHGSKIISSKDIADTTTACKYPLSENMFTIQTALAEYTVELVCGFAEPVLFVWSDNHKNYICIEWVQFDWPSHVIDFDPPLGTNKPYPVAGHMFLNAVEWKMTVNTIY